MSISKNILRKIFHKAADDIKGKGSKEIMEEYNSKKDELNKIGSEMIPNERLDGRPIQINAERIEMPVRTVPIIMRESDAGLQSAASSKGKWEASETHLQESQELQPTEIRVIAEKGSNVAPMIFEFPKLSEELKSITKKDAPTNTRSTFEDGSVES